MLTLSEDETYGTFGFAIVCYLRIAISASASPSSRRQCKCFYYYYDDDYY